MFYCCFVAGDFRAVSSFRVPICLFHVALWTLVQLVIAETIGKIFALHSGNSFNFLLSWSWLWSSESCENREQLDLLHQLEEKEAQALRARDRETEKVVSAECLNFTSFSVTDPELTRVARKDGELKFSRICWTSETINLLFSHWSLVYEPGSPAIPCRRVAYTNSLQPELWSKAGWLLLQ